jgi:transporter family-2 protein
LNLILTIAAFVAGALLPLQTLINGRLSALVGSSVLAGATSFQVGAAVLFAYHFLSRSGANGFRLSEAPAWIWTGGFMGGLYMVAVISGVPRLGAASIMSLVVLGQICASILLDHYGVLSQITHPLSAARVGGALLVCAGVWIVTHN